MIGNLRPLHHRLAILCGMLLLVGLGAPGQASVDVTVEFRHSPEEADEEEARDWTPHEGAVLTGPWSIVADFEAVSSLKRVEITVLRVDLEEPEEVTRISNAYEFGHTKEETIRETWDTTSLTPHNGIYEIRGEAEGHSGQINESAVGDLKVNNPPNPPRNIDVRIRDGVPLVLWDPNKEPDIAAYRVLRSVNQKPFEVATSTIKTQFIDADAPVGSLRYQVVAVRYSPVEPAGLTSRPSNTSRPVMVVPPEGPSQPTALDALRSAVLERPRARTIPVDDAFAPYLPYPEADLIAMNLDSQAAPPAKLPFMAAALWLLVCSLHLLKLATRLRPQPDPVNPQNRKRHRRKRPPPISPF